MPSVSLSGQFNTTHALRGRFTPVASMTYLETLLSLSPVAVWPLGEDAGSVANEWVAGRNGVYSGVALGQPGIGDGAKSAGFDGAASYVNAFTSGLAAAVSRTELTMLIWIKTAASVWTDATARIWFVYAADNNNQILMFKGSVANQANAQYIAGGVTKTATATASKTDWMCAALTVSTSHDRLIFYLDGAQAAAPVTGLGVFAGSILNCVIGSNRSHSANFGKGNLAFASLWARELTAAEVLTASTAFKAVDAETSLQGVFNA